MHLFIVLRFASHFDAPKTSPALCTISTIAAIAGTAEVYCAIATAAATTAYFTVMAAIAACDRLE